MSNRKNVIGVATARSVGGRHRCARTPSGSVTRSRAAPALRAPRVAARAQVAAAALAAAVAPRRSANPQQINTFRSQWADGNGGVTMSGKSAISVVSLMRRLGVGLAMTVLVSGTLGLGAGIAHANPSGPYQWCPGPNPPPETAIWDMSRCHTYWLVDHGQGNVDGSPIVGDGTPLARVWDGDNPPASGPPPNLPPFLCRSEFPPQTCDAWGL